MPAVRRKGGSRKVPVGSRPDVCGPEVGAALGFDQKKAIQTCVWELLGGTAESRNGAPGGSLGDLDGSWESWRDGKVPLTARND